MGFFRNPIDSMASKMAFFPPEPATYELHDKVNKEGDIELVVCSPYKKAPIVKNCDTFTLRTKHGSDIVACYMATRRHSDPVLLFSHGNAVDIGQMLPFHQELGEELKCNIMCYDYSGYGRSSGTPSVTNSQNDISACLEWLSAAGKQASDVVLYGQSIGSGPSVYLASKEKGLGGLILHSPLASGMQVMNPGWTRWPSFLDVFPNSQLMPKVQCPVFVMHGTKDEVIPFSHGEKLHSLAKKPFAPFWVPDGTHQNIECNSQYVEKLQSFLEEVFGKKYWKRYEG